MYVHKLVTFSSLKEGREGQIANVMEVEGTCQAKLPFAFQRKQLGTSQFIPLSCRTTHLVLAARL